LRYVKYVFLAILLLFFTACSEKRKLKIAANPWIGYVPLFYLQKSGELKNFEIIKTSSLKESLNFFDTGIVDAMAATNYEQKKAVVKVFPVIYLDKSYGGDVVMANFNFKNINKKKKINVYLEYNSVNSILFNAFVKKFNFPKNKFIINDKYQYQILNMKKFQPDSLIVTYVPFNKEFERKNFKTVFSTKTEENIIIDAIFADCKTIKTYKNEFRSLYLKIQKVIKLIKQKPLKVYEKIKSYFPKDYTFEDFMKDLGNIKWILKFKGSCG